MPRLPQGGGDTAGQLLERAAQAEEALHLGGNDQRPVVRAAHVQWDHPDRVAGDEPVAGLRVVRDEGENAVDVPEELDAAPRLEGVLPFRREVAALAPR